MFIELIKGIKEDISNKVSTSFRASKTDLEILDIYTTYLSLQTNKKIKRSEIISILIKQASKILKEKIIKKIQNDDNDKFTNEIIKKISQKQKIKIEETIEIIEILKENKKYELIYELMIEKKENLKNLIIPNINSNNKIIYEIGKAYNQLKNINISLERSKNYKNKVYDIKLSFNDFKSTLILGAAGSGKTFLTMNLLTEQKEKENIRTIYLDLISDENNAKIFKRNFNKNCEIIDIYNEDKINIFNKNAEYIFYILKDEKINYKKTKIEIIKMLENIKKENLKINYETLYKYFMNIEKIEKVTNDIKQQEEIIEFGKMLRTQKFLKHFFTENDGKEIKNKSIYIKSIAQFFFEKEEMEIIEEKLLKIIKKEIEETIKTKQKLSIVIDDFKQNRNSELKKEILKNYQKYNINIYCIAQELNMTEYRKYFETIIILRIYDFETIEYFNNLYNLTEEIIRLETGSGYIILKDKKVPVIFT
jgi:energy-coupling factor transporter ATP-binding protein EcfA2